MNGLVADWSAAAGVDLRPWFAAYGWPVLSDDEEWDAIQFGYPTITCYNGGVAAHSVFPTPFRYLTDSDYEILTPGTAVAAVLQADVIDAWQLELPEPQRIRIELRSPPGGAAAWLGLDAGTWSTSRWGLAGLDTALTANLPAGTSRITVTTGPGGRPGAYAVCAMPAPIWPPALTAPTVISGASGRWLVVAPTLPDSLAGRQAITARWWIANRGWVAVTPVYAGHAVPLAWIDGPEDPGSQRVRVQWYQGDLPAWPISEAATLPVSEQTAPVGVN
jgi:hypothetical protein